ncbi:hypothetical protein ALC53_10565 [Atta colombica]|uniref:PLAT domain-containing protein n=1 Tax=Atta colombica TaxID=520822 RepID=A0A195B3E6_9HYME|nr:hypothetical protein ALC53_10565 [Atta colombica]
MHAVDDIRYHVPDATGEILRVMRADHQQQQPARRLCKRIHTESDDGRSIILRVCDTWAE